MYSRNRPSFVQLQLSAQCYDTTEHCFHEMIMTAKGQPTCNSTSRAAKQARQGSMHIAVSSCAFSLAIEALSLAYTELAMHIAVCALHELYAFTDRWYHCKLARHLLVHCKLPVSIMLINASIWRCNAILHNQQFRLIVWRQTMHPLQSMRDEQSSLVASQEMHLDPAI